MVTVATRGAEKDGLRGTRSRVHASAFPACLAAVGGRHLDEGASRPCELVAEHVREAGPSRIRDTASAATSNHPRNVQPLQHNDAVALGESCRLDVQEVVALPPDLAVDAAHGLFVDRTITFVWVAWDAGLSALPEISGNGNNLVVFSGMPASASYSATTTISTPGAPYTLKWDGTNWVPQ